jgi:hypothetical protein
MTRALLKTGAPYGISSLKVSIAIHQNSFTVSI